MTQVRQRTTSWVTKMDKLKNENNIDGIQDESDKGGGRKVWSGEMGKS